ncbi:glycosyltransferase family 4 protein [Nesterenkonia sp. NBAIMH1]|uniref:glycosyltransferase family 4 protein n=1 Tax=Nesterenkonia sp. NBAIMH1 TaxID=2600320 RepID=UPI0011B81D71|nr:glycosyltransferase family 4 protein [Nesterenkonia sp. NBAIMH1]
MAPSREYERAFLVPADLPGPSGGSIYNARVLDAWREVGAEVEEVAVGGTWPAPDHQAERELARRLTQCRSALVDGIIASAAPDALAEAQADGVEVSVLMHLPLPAETGLSLQQQRDAAALERSALHRADRILCTSQWAAQDIIARYGPLQCEAVPPGADARAPATGSDPPKILFLGSLSPRKNPLLLLRALEPLADLEWQLQITGPAGPDPSYAEALSTAARRLPGRVSITGPLQGRALESAWESADLLTLPSLAETYGMVVTEAIAHGVPAVVGAGTGAVEALASGLGVPSAVTDQTLPGSAADPEDVRAWTTLLERWLQQEDLRARWRANALRSRDRLRPWSETAKSLRTALGW